MIKNTRINTLNSSVKANLNLDSKSLRTGLLVFSATSLTGGPSKAAVSVSSGSKLLSTSAVSTCKRDFSLKIHKNYLNGDWVNSAGHPSFDVINPAT